MKADLSKHATKGLDALCLLNNPSLWAQRGWALHESVGDFDDFQGKALSSVCTLRFTSVFVKCFALEVDLLKQTSGCKGGSLVALLHQQRNRRAAAPAKKLE